ncbi:S8 family peptidase [Bacteriovorax sp. PP10]|uniref:S8 family peptidase n=1 Tax=Bacteriovorax antarcticus TaxID=3088717 RepID=A0ABU5VXB6_9BACT|nr:S8 family peptidase [Bacteriovorax sp. PP10]MEA9357715.1 S8 family peptidase [Bacteriovorax sp. PP10]
MKFLLMSMLVLTMTSAHAAITPTELVVKVKAGKAVPNFGADSKVQNLFGNIYIVRNNDVSVLEKQLKNNPNIEYTERNSRAEKSPLPMPVASPLDVEKSFKAVNLFNDPKVDKIWSFNDADKNGVSVNAAYQLHGTSATSTVIVAVVDTGIDYTHEDLKDVVWVNEGEIPGNGIDDDGNGYVDDVNGINTLVRDSQGRATGNNKDTHSHGTHVSGTIGAKQNNGIGIAGIASNVKIIGIKTVPNSSDETDIDVAESFIYAAKNGAKIINCSFGKGQNEGKNLIPDTLKYIQDKYGVLVIAAAGNDTSDIDKYPTYPASHKSDNLLIIASTTKTGALSSFSNYGKVNVDVAAPGSDVFSTTPGNRYASMSGTSMASPTTTGVAAEILSHYPNLSPLQLKQVIMDSVNTDYRYKDKMITGGRIDLLKGLELARSIK